MKPSVLEALTEETTKRIEEKVDSLLNAAGITFEDAGAPVRRSVHKLQTVERIEKKLALLTQAQSEVPAEVPTEQAQEQAEAQTPDERPAKSKKSK